MKGKQITPERLAELKVELKAHREASKNINHNEALTIAALKNYKDQIIKTIIEMAGASEVKKVMTKMVELLPTTENTCEVDFAKEVMCKMGYFNNASANLSEMNREAGRKLMSIR